MQNTAENQTEDDLTALKRELLAGMESAADTAALEEWRVAALGKKGRITDLMKTLGALQPDARKARGAPPNVLKDEIAAALESKHKILAETALNARITQERIDVTLSPRPLPEGRIHPISQTIDEIVSIFGSMGFSVAKGPDIESDHMNFTMLNIPPNHPARQMQDTFYLSSTEEQPSVLRTQTSAVQIRTLMKQKPPLRIVAPGRCYRVENDMTHTPMFHQFEVLVIDENTHMGHLKGCLMDFLRAFFGIKDLPVRFRPSYFPFTEPSAEVDIGCSRKNGELKLGSYGDWLEIAGAGMVHPNVLRNCGLDPDIYQGFAFGTGIERIAMLKYGIPDLRTFFEADVRWLRHYGFAAGDTPQ